MSADIKARRLEVLRVAQADSDRPQKVIAREAGITEPALSKHMRDAKADKTIKGIVAILDRSKLGFYALCFFRVEFHNWQSSRAAAEILRNDPFVQEIHFLDGSSPLLVRVCARTNEDLADWQTKVLKFDGVQSVRGNIVVKTIHETHQLAI